MFVIFVDRNINVVPHRAIRKNKSLEAQLRIQIAPFDPA